MFLLAHHGPTPPCSKSQRWRVSSASSRRRTWRETFARRQASCTSCRDCEWCDDDRTPKTCIQRSLTPDGEMTEAEFIVTAGLAEGGIRIENPNASDALALLKHFGSGNPGAGPHD